LARKKAKHQCLQALFKHCEKLAFDSVLKCQRGQKVDPTLASIGGFACQTKMV
jgi:hypothetical protein